MHDRRDGRTKFNDPSGYRTCSKCLTTFLATWKYFHKCEVSFDRCAPKCKSCANKERTERWFSKSSHNVHMHCYKCKSFFWQTRAQINKSIRRNPNAHFYCSIRCGCLDNAHRKGVSWNGARKGDNNPNAKLNSHIVKMIKEKISAGLKNIEIAKLFNLKYSHISLIRNGRLWSHI